MPAWLQVVAAIAQVVIAGGAVWGVWVAIRSSRETRHAIEDIGKLVEIERQRDEERRSEQKRAELSAQIEQETYFDNFSELKVVSFIVISNAGPGAAHRVAVNLTWYPTKAELDAQEKTGTKLDDRHEDFSVGVIGRESSFRWRAYGGRGRVDVRLEWRDDGEESREFETELLTTHATGVLNL